MVVIVVAGCDGVISKIQQPKDFILHLKYDIKMLFSILNITLNLEVLWCGGGTVGGVSGVDTVSEWCRHCVMIWFVL